MADPHIEHLVPLPDESISGLLTLATSTETTILASAGAGMRNYLRFLHVSTADIANQIIIRDGTAGTILARVIATQNDNKDYEFFPALRGSENTVMTIQVSGAVSSNYYLNAYGYKRAN